MTTKKVLIFLNPAAGKGNANYLAKSLLRYAMAHDIHCVVVESQDATEISIGLAEAIAGSHYDALIAIGGDGLVHSAIQVIADSQTPLYVVPAGTGNDFARSNGLLETNPSVVFNIIYGTEPVSIDLGRIKNEDGLQYFGQILSTGFDAQVNACANEHFPFAGRMKYNFATLVELPKFKSIMYALEIDGVKRDLRAMLVAIANGPTYGGGMQLCPMADRSDGFLDILILHPVSKVELLKVFPKVYSGRHIAHPAVEFIKTRKITVSANTSAYADGERIGSLPIEVDVLSKSLRTWAKI